MLGGYIIGDWLSIDEGFDQDRLANVGILHDWEYNLIIKLLENPLKLPKVITFFPQICLLVKDFLELLYRRWKLSNAGPWNHRDGLRCTKNKR